MTITIKGRKYDYAADRLDCQNEHGVFESHAEREEWRKGHEGHDVDLYLQAHVISVPFPPEMGYQPGMGPLHPARSPGLNPS